MGRNVKDPGKSVGGCNFRKGKSNVFAGFESLAIRFKAFGSKPRRQGLLWFLGRRRRPALRCPCADQETLAAMRKHEQEYGEQVRRVRGAVHSLVVEVLRYQTWK